MMSARSFLQVSSDGWIDGPGGGTQSTNKERHVCDHVAIRGIGRQRLATHENA
jgi:hypothetical protein